MQKDLFQRTKTISLLRQFVYPKPPLQPPALIAWGCCQHESIIRSTKGWLGVSPDG